MRGNQKDKIYHLVITALWWLVCLVSSNSNDIAMLDELESGATANGISDPRYIADQLRRSIRPLLTEKLRSHALKLYFAFCVTNSALILLTSFGLRLLLWLMPAPMIHFFHENLVAQGHLSTAYFAVVFVTCGMIGAAFAAGCEIEAVTLYGAVFTATFFLSHLNLPGTGYAHLLTPSLILGAYIVKKIRTVVSENTTLRRKPSR